METNDKETCIQFGLSNANKCSYCQNWETRRLTNPGKKRTTKCLRPWEFRKGANPSKANNGTIKRVCDCWDQMILGEFYTVNQVPSDICGAASLISHEFVAPPAKLLRSNSDDPTNGISNSFNSLYVSPQQVKGRRFSRRSRKEMSPTAVNPTTPSNQIKKIGKSKRTTNIHDEKRSHQSTASTSAPQLKQPAFDGVRNLLERRFHHSHNLVGNLCASGTIADDNNNDEHLHSDDVIANLVNKKKIYVQQKEIELLNEENKNLRINSSDTKFMNDENRKLIELLAKENKLLQERVGTVEKRIEMMAENELNNHQVAINKGYLKR